jgi:hypothetical protein
MLWTVLIGNLFKVAITYSTSSVKNFYNRRHLRPSPASFLSTQPYTCIKFKKLRQFKSWFASWNWNALENTPFAAWTHVGTVWSRPLIAPYQSCAQWPENHPVVPGLHFWRCHVVRNVSTDKPSLYHSRSKFLSSTNISHPNPSLPRSSIVAKKGELTHSSPSVTCSSPRFLSSS